MISNKHILIDTHKVSVQDCAYSLPWKNDAFCMNFNRPEEVIPPDEIGLINRDNTETIVIGCALKDVSFLKDFRNLRQLYIYDGRNVEDLSFLESMLLLKQFVLHGSHVCSIQSMVSLLEKKKEKIETGSDFLHNQLPYIMEGICMDSDHDLINKECVIPYRRYVSEVILNGHALWD